MKVEDIAKAITELSPQERAWLRAWMAKFEATQSQATQSQGAPAPEESTATKLGRFAGRAFADLRRKMKEP